ncbi:hypothetical protein [Anaerolactibacter massiliensis]|uniref:hypothetical protein n=1 Tax=Anaerolactibacter massiliensis TaxID=2044573 RepID=UPI000CFA3A52|nr:hypothetical protein [Anaerolactibacter massiliensis]MDD6365954.1 hypothetical protein [Stecheria intestinalis]
MAEKKQKKNTGLKVILVILIAAIIGLFGYSRIKTKVVKQAAEVVVRDQLKNYGITDSQIDSVLNQIDEQDQETITNIVSDHVSVSSIQEVQKYVASGDLQGLAEYAESELSDTEKQELTDLAAKYKNQIVLP